MPDQGELAIFYTNSLANSQNEFEGLTPYPV